VLIEVQAHKFALFGDPKHAYSIERREHCHGAGEGGGADNQATDTLRLQHFYTAAIELASESFGRLGNDRGNSERTRTSCGVFAAGEQAQ